MYQMDSDNHIHMLLFEYEIITTNILLGFIALLIIKKCRYIAFVEFVFRGIMNAHEKSSLPTVRRAGSHCFSYESRTRDTRVYCRLITNFHGILYL